MLRETQAVPRPPDAQPLAPANGADSLPTAAVPYEDAKLPPIEGEPSSQSSSTFSQVLKMGREAAGCTSSKARDALVSIMDRIAKDPDAEAGCFRKSAHTVFTWLPVVGKWKLMADMRAEYLAAKESADAERLSIARTKGARLLAELGLDAATLGRGGFARKIVFVNLFHKVRSLPLIRSVPGMQKLDVLDPVHLISKAIAGSCEMYDVVETVFGAPSKKASREGDPASSYPKTPR